MTVPDEDTESDKYGRRKVLKVTGTGVAGSLAGCITSGGDDEGSGTTEITYYDRESGAETVAETFNESYSEIEVSPQLGGDSGEGAYRQFNSQMQSDRGPEVVGTDMLLRNSFVESEYLREIDNLVSELDYRDDFYDSLDPLWIEYQGTSYTLPFTVDPSNYFYNKHHFEEAGLDPENPPETWSEFREAAEALSTDDQPAISLQGISGSSFLWLPWVWAGGGRFINDDDECVIDEDPGVNALEFWVDLADNGLCIDPVATQWTDMRNMFANEQTSILFDGGGAIPVIDDVNPDLFDHVGNRPFPRPEDGAHAGMTGGNAIAITTAPDDDSDALEAAQEFIKWVNTKEGMEAIFDIGYVPGRKSGFELDAANQEDTGELYQGLASVLEAENSRMLTHRDTNEAKNEYLNPHLEAAYAGDETPEEALSATANEINENVLD